MERPHEDRDGVLLDGGPGAGDDRRSLWAAPDDRDRRVGADVRLERRGLVHLGDRLYGVAGGDEATQLRPVLVEHPAVGADEGADPARFEPSQGGLEEGDIEVGPAKSWTTDRHASSAVSGSSS